MTAEPITGPDFSQANGLLPAIVQDVETREILMLAYMNEEAYLETLRKGQAVYWSRSRNRLWHKGEESGHFQTVDSISIDCDADTILLKVRQQGVACHEGYRSCFFRDLTDEGIQINATRLVDPATIYPKSAD